MSVAEFEGGPLHGRGALYEEQAEEPAAEGGDADEGALFQQILQAARSLLSMDSLSEQNKLLLEQATTMVQKVKASEEKEMNDAMSGKLSPGVLRKAASGGSSY